MIENLNLRIKELQDMMDALSHRGDCHNQDNQLQAIVDNLTAKKLELEAQLAKMTEQALTTAAELHQLKASIENKLQQQIV